MAGASFFALLDDITAILDDVALMTKVAAKKTVGVLGDDLALNAQQVSGVKADRELPVVWAVAKGSFRNKLILVPMALLISAFIPWAITPLLMLGGMFLCFEGFEKILHTLTASSHPSSENEKAKPLENMDDQSSLVAEKDKIKGAITTDFILSAEIIAIALGTVAGKSLLLQFSVLAVVSITMTAGVYGLVAAIVKLDDGGLYLMQRQGQGKITHLLHKIGKIILYSAPYLMRGLTVVGTVAMFMVGGGIVAHGVHIVSSMMNNITLYVGHYAYLGNVLAIMMPTLLNALWGIVVGALVFIIVSLCGRLRTLWQ
ncbi:MAG: DUF808 domain-containing protein [Plesiomonas sp.]|uniref:DUF808 domain-containing protein n=1 Tax=Plesiomonas sp. TaxID=2486279 RepID=UPI003F39587F